MRPDHARLRFLRFRKSSHSGGGNGGCIELAAYGSHFAIRDSKDVGGPILFGFGASDLREFVREVRNGRF